MYLAGNKQDRHNHFRSRFHYIQKNRQVSNALFASISAALAYQFVLSYHTLRKTD